MATELKPPVDVDAEEQIIAYFLQEPEGRGELLAALSPADFANVPRGRLWEQMQSLASVHGPAAVDEVLLRDRVRQMAGHDGSETWHVLEHIAGTVLTNLPPDPLGTARLEKAAIVGRLARRRAGIEVLTRGLTPLCQRDCDPEDTLAALSAALHGLVDGWRTKAVGRNGAGNRKARYVVLTDTEAEACKLAPGLIGDILYADSIAYLFAAKDTWKTFTALSMGCCIAAGVPWLGRRVQQGPVVYVAAEGRRGVGKRLTAWKRHHGIDRSIDLVVVPMPVNLLDPSAIPDLMAALEDHPPLHGRKPALIVFDTLARSMDGGDENETKDANAVTAAAGLLKERYGCCVLIVHHSGWSAQGRMRGNSAYEANGDIVMRIVAPALEDGQRRAPGSVVTLYSKHAKETDNFEDIQLTTFLESWTDDDGVSDSSLVIVSASHEQLEAHEQQAQQDRRRLKGAQRTALDALAASQDGLGAQDWLRASQLHKSTFYTAIRALGKLGAVEYDPDNAKYRLTEAGREWVT